MIYEALICFLMKQQHFKMLPIVSFGKLSRSILLTFQFLHIRCSLFPCILCLLYCICICFVSTPYALTPEFYVNKDMFCSVLFTELLAFNIRNGFQGLNNRCSAHKKRA